MSDSGTPQEVNFSCYFVKEYVFRGIISNNVLLLMLRRIHVNQ